MPRRSLRFAPALSILAVLQAWPAAGAAQTLPPEAGAISLSLTVGLPGSGELQAQPVQLEHLGEDGEVVETVVLRRGLRTGGGFQVNGALTFAVGPVWSVRVGGGLGRTTVSHSYSGSDTWDHDAAAAPIAGSQDVRITVVEGALRYVVSTAQALRPYLEMGGSAERWSGDVAAAGGLAGAEPLGDGVTRIGGHVAVGGDYPLTDRIGVRFQASARMARTPLPPIPPGTELVRADTLVLTSLPPGSAAFGDSAIELVTRLRLELGLSYALRRAAGAPAGRSGSPGSSSAPRR